MWIANGALARISCRVAHLYPGGDHTIIVGAIDALDTRDGAPLAFHASRFGRFAAEKGSGQVDPWPDPGGVWM